MGEPTPVAVHAPGLSVKGEPVGVPLPVPRLPTRVGWYAATLAAVTLLAAVGFRLDAQDLRAPLLYHDPRGLETDALLILPMVKATVERGSHWRCERLGAPGMQEMHDFPVVDHFHFLWLWVLGRFTPDAVLVFNLYHLLTYPLTALTAMAVLRHFGLSLPAATVGGVLYAFAPYHMARGENHYFLAAYYVVPLTLMVILWVCDGRLPFFPPAPDGGRRFRLLDRTTLAAVVVAVVTASAGAYYAFFACGLLVGAGVYGWVARRTWKAAASAGLVIGVIFAAGVANHAPAFPYESAYGRHTAPTERFPEEAEYYGLKIAQLVLPIEDHSLEPLAFVKSTYNSVDRPVQSWTERYSLGTVGTVGLLLLLYRVIFPVPRGWPYGPLAALTAFAVLIGTVGGFGAVFNHLVSPQVRCYNRIAIYIAFLCLFAVLWPVDGWVRRLAARHRGRRWTGWAYPAAVWAGLAWFGVWDQTPFYWGGEKTAERQRDQSARFHTDAEFFRRIEDALNPDGVSPGPMVFQLPYMKWPESPPVVNLFAYEHARGYVHTRTLRWSFGCMKGREVDEWYRRVIVLPPDRFLVSIEKAGFEGLLLDKRGYTPRRAEELHQTLAYLSGHAREIVHPDGKQVFFDLRTHRDWIRQQTGRSWDEECWRETHPLTLLWLHGFTSFKEPGLEWQHRWCGPSGLAVFVNPTGETRTVTTLFDVRTESKEPARLTIDGGDVWSETLTIDKDTPTQQRTFVIPPGRHPVRFRCTPPADYIPTDPRKLLFFIAGLRVG